MSQIWMVDIDGSLTDWPDELGELMRALLARGDDVQVLSGVKGHAVTQADLEEKTALLQSLGVSDCYTKLTVVSDPKNHVAHQKVNYMQLVGATAMVDNDKQNVKAARKAGFLALRVGKRK